VTADYAQLSDLFARYAAAADDHDDTMLRDVLADDARFVAEIAGGPTVGPSESSDAVVEFIFGTTAKQLGQRRHVMTNIWMDGNIAHALVSLFETVDGQLNFRTTGTYRVTVVEQNGSLRFSNIAVHLDRAS
jgi:SnoaL-like domain